MVTQAPEHRTQGLLVAFDRRQPCVTHTGPVTTLWWQGRFLRICESPAHSLAAIHGTAYASGEVCHSAGVSRRSFWPLSLRQQRRPRPVWMMDTLTPEQRQAVRKAALEELVAKGIDEFSIAGVAMRSAIPGRLIIQEWHDRRVLLMDSQINIAGVPDPDTGTLRGDLQVFTDLLSRILLIPQGRRWFHRLLPADDSFDAFEVRADSWAVVDGHTLRVLKRAQQRGELREDVDLLVAAQVWKAAILHDLVFADKPIRREYADQLTDLFVRGLTRRDS